jgi:hypothetical protein
LGEDVLSSPFTREVYTIEGFNFTRNDSFLIIFSKNPDTIPFYLNNEGVFYTEGNIVLVYWKEDIQQYQLGILNQSTGEMAVSNIILPKSMQNEPGFDFHLFSTSQKLADSPEKSVYWFTVQNPNEPHSSTTKSYHIIRCIVP